MRVKTIVRGIRPTAVAMTCSLTITRSRGVKKFDRDFDTVKSEVCGEAGNPIWIDPAADSSRIRLALV